MHISSPTYEQFSAADHHFESSAQSEGFLSWDELVEARFRPHESTKDRNLDGNIQSSHICKSKRGFWQVALPTDGRDENKKYVFFLNVLQKNNKTE